MASREVLPTAIVPQGTLPVILRGRKHKQRKIVLMGKEVLPTLVPHIPRKPRPKPSQPNTTRIRKVAMKALDRRPFCVLSSRSRRRAAHSIAREGFKGSSKGLEFYKTGPVLGQGAFGKVTLGWHRITGRTVAIKTYTSAIKNDPSMWRQVKNEMRCMKRLHFPSVVHLHEMITTKLYTHLIMEFVQGQSLKALMRRSKAQQCLPEDMCKLIGEQVSSGLCHIHDRNVVHRDIKVFF